MSDRRNINITNSEFNSPKRSNVNRNDILYSKGSGENEQERCTLILRPLIPGIFGSAFRKIVL